MNFQVLVVPIKPKNTNDINRHSSIEEVLAHPDVIQYELGRYFEDQNKGNIGLHWSFFVDLDTKSQLNGFYNKQIFGR